jgi:hypothetical protein
MELQKTIDDLYLEKARLDRVIAAVEGLQQTVAPRPLPRVPRKRGRKSMDPDERLEVSQRMRKYWADRRAEERSGDGRR